MEIKDFIVHLSDTARELGDSADWYNSMHVPTLYEYVRYQHFTVCDLIDVVRAECKTMDDVDELLDQMRYCSYNEYKHCQSEHFEHLAELAFVKYSILGEIVSDIERNK